MQHARTRPLWSVVEEHLEEAEFLWQMWEHSLVAPHFDLDAVAEGPELRLRAHLDGLVLGGPRVARRLLLPALAHPDPGRVSAAATALLLGAPTDDSLDAILEILRERPEQRPALVRALACVDAPPLRRRLRDLLMDLDPAVVAAAAEIALFRHEPLGEAMGLLMAIDDRLVRAMALRAVADEPDPGMYLHAIQAGLQELDPAVLDAAIAAGTRLDLAPAWARARARMNDPDGAEAMLLLALKGTAADHTRLISALADRKRRAAALWALGFLGTPEAVDAALEWLEDATVGPLVGEVLTAVTGVDLERADLSLPPGDEEPLAHRPEDDLARPNPMAVLQWWMTHRGRFAAGQRHVLGRPRTAASLADALRSGPMRRRAGYLLDLALATPSRPPRVQLRAPTARQRAELASL